MKSAAYLVALSNRIFTMPVPPSRSVVDDGTPFGRNRLYQKPSWGTRPNPVYQLTDRLHDGHVARVSGREIAPTVSSWLAELGARSPLVDELARAVQDRDWPAAYAIGETLSVDVSIAS